MLAASSGEPATPAEPPPSAELLLYLGEFEDNEGDFVDPMALDALPDQPKGATSARPADVEGTEKRDEIESRPE